MKLRDICNNNTAQQLKEIAKSHGLSGYSKMKKAELVELIVNHLLNYDVIQDSIMLADHKELSCFEQVCKGDVTTLPEDINAYIYFFMKGYYNMNDRNEISIPEEVKRMYPVIMNGEFVKQRDAFHKVLDYCKACVNLYGIVPIEQVVKLYKQNTNEVITKEQLSEVVKKAQERNCIVEIKGDELIHELLMSNENAYQVLTNKQMHKPFYIPEKGILIHYADDNYMEENDQQKVLLNYLKANFFMSDEMAKDACYEIECLYGEGLEATQILDDLIKKGVEISGEEQKTMFLQRIIDYTNNVRLWENRGNTKVELGLASNPSLLLNVPTSNQRVNKLEKKIGRNQPCPCGSGKKYKYCCGR